MIANSYPIHSDNLLDDLLPSNDMDKGFSSMELPVSRPRNRKREARPIYTLILDILDTVYTSSKVII